MNRITEITRRGIFDIIKDGFDENVLVAEKKDHSFSEFKEEYKHEYMPYYGRLTEIEFLERLYNLNELPSKDTRFNNAYEDIYCHTVSFDDWPENWILNDERFQLKVGCDDEPLLRFICEMLHPAVRITSSPWESYLYEFNKILGPDGYELYITNIISGKEVYGFREKDVIEIPRYMIAKTFFQLHMIGEGSYATVYKYKDDFYNKTFAVKRAKKSLNSKEMERFKIEYEQMSKFRSPYIVEVYSYIEDKNEYIMEYMDSTLEKYIEKENTGLNIQQRENIIEQLFRGFNYIHSKRICHRDVSYSNILIKEYDTEIRVKISDFGLVKLPDSDLTSEKSEIKGHLYDPSLKIRGFTSYDTLDEIYALTSLFAFVITGKKNFKHVNEKCVKNFWEKGICPDRYERYQTLDELREAAFKCMEELQQQNIKE